jgi:polyferredoxin
MAMLILITGLATTRGRLYCNTICPVGALLGFFSKVSFLRISIDTGVCSGGHAALSKPGEQAAQNPGSKAGQFLVDKIKKVYINTKYDIY